MSQRRTAAASPSSDGGDDPTGQRRVGAGQEGATKRRRELPEGVKPLPTGFVIGSYVVEDLIDVGGGGIVYLARHRVLTRQAALKVLREDIASPAMVVRFTREAAAVSKIRHPNVVEIYEFGEIDPGRPYYVMELLEGTDVRKLLRSQGRMSPEEALAIFEPVCLAAQAAHDAGIVHRDIKSSNVVIVERNGARVIKLVDFGIAKPMVERAGQGLTEPGSIVGTPHAMAPEQIRSDKVDARTDVYALGVLAFHMLTARYPFEANDPVEIAMQHLQAPPPRPSDWAPISPALDGVVLRCLEKVPAKRFASATDLLAAFRTAVGHAGQNVAVSEWGVGIYFEVKTSGEGELDDEMLMDIGNVMDTIEQGLAESRCTFPFRTSNALLGVRVVGSREAAQQAREEVAASLEQWHAILADRPDRHPDVEVTASLSVGQALCRHGASGDEIVGGPLLDFEAWKNDDRIRLG